MPNDKATRAYVSEFTVQVGPVNVLGRLVPVIKTGAGDYKKFVSVCPDCDTPTKPKQTYICNSNHSHSIGELLKAKELDNGNLAFVAKEEIDAARASDLPLNQFRASVVSRDVLLNSTWDADSAYVFEPRVYDNYYALLARLITDSDYSFIAPTNVRNNEGFWRLDVWRGQIIVQRLLWPDECNEFNEPDIECADDAFNAAVGMLDRIATHFDPADAQSTVKSRLVDLVEALDSDAPRPEVAVTQTTDTTVNQQDMLSLLNAFGSPVEQTAPVRKVKRTA